MDFDELFCIYSKRLYHVAYGVTRDSYLAEDVVQETFIKAYKKIDTIDDPEKMGAWLSSIAARTAIDFIRSERRKYALPMEQEPLERACNAGGGCQQDVEEAAGLIFLKEEIEQHIQRLTNDYKEVLLLRVNGGLKETEIAARLNLKPATVKTRLYRARKQLKFMFSETSTA